MIRRISMFCAVILIALGSYAQAAGVEMAIGGWRQSISGQLSYQALSDQDVLDLENDLIFDDESRLTGRIKIDMPLFLPNIYLVAAPMEFEGAGIKSGTLNFGGKTFDFSAGLTSKITLNQYDIGFYYGLPFLKTGTLNMLNLDLGLNVRVMDMEAAVTGISGGTRAQSSKSVNLPVPMLYVGVQFTPTEALAFEAEGRGLSVGGNKLYSLIGRVRLNFAGPVFVAGGYRFDKVDIDEDDLVADVDFQGPFVEMGLKF